MNKHEQTDRTSRLEIIKQNLDDFLFTIQNKLGLHILPHQFNQLYETLLSACEKFNCSPKRYLTLIKNSNAMTLPLEHLIAGLTISETYFFRDKSQMQLLQESVLPQLIHNKRNLHELSLRIWSAGCSTGEEIYTIAIMLKELLPDFDQWQLTLLGTDINTASLHKALDAKFKEWSMRAISDYFKTTYFTKSNEYYVLLKELRDLVKFSYLNLHIDDYPSILNGSNAQDLILCRNVLIYFKQSSIHAIMQKLNASLIPGGYLLLGSSDPIQIKGLDFVYHYKQGLLFSKSLSPDVKPIIQKEKARNNLLPEAATKKVKAQLNPPEAKVLLPSKPAPLSITDQARELANLGKLHEAINLCKKAIQEEPTNKLLYLNYALILIELNQLEAGEKMLRHCLFLDRNFVIAHFRLGLLLMNQGKNLPGLKSLKNALAIAKSNPLNDIVPGTDITQARLIEILQSELSLHTHFTEQEHA